MLFGQCPNRGGDLLKGASLTGLRAGRFCFFDISLTLTTERLFCEASASFYLTLKETLMDVRANRSGADF